MRTAAGIQAVKYVIDHGKVKAKPTKSAHQSDKEALAALLRRRFPRREQPDTAMWFTA